MVIKVDAVVVKEYVVGESDKYITLIIMSTIIHEIRS